MVQPLLRHVDVTAQLSTGTQDITLLGGGIPVAAYFLFNEGVSAGTEFPGGGMGHGACTAAAQFCSTSVRDDANAAGTVAK